MLTLEKLERTLHIRQTIDKLQEELHSIYSSFVGAVSPSPAKKRGGKNGKKGRAKVKGTKIATDTISNSEAADDTIGNGRKKRKKMSAAGKARIAAAQKARWAKVKAQKNS